MGKNKSTMINQLFDKFIVAITFISNILMVILALVVFLEVMSRYVFKYPFVFTGELTQLLFPWLVFLGAIAVTKNEDHLSINYFRNRFSKKVQRIILIISKMIMIYFSFFMLISSFELSKAVMTQPLPVMRISKAWLYSSVTVAFIGITILLIYQIILLFLNKTNLGEGDSYDLGNDR